MEAVDESKRRVQRLLKHHGAIGVVQKGPMGVVCSPSLQGERKIGERGRRVQGRRESSRAQSRVGQGMTLCGKYARVVPEPSSARLPCPDNRCRAIWYESEQSNRCNTSKT